MSRALLVLEDGTSFEGISCGAEAEVFGELCFNTSMIGYPEVVSDPSYAGQIIMMTYPQIGNYGVALDSLQRSTLSLKGLVVREMCFEPSNYRSNMSLPQLLLEQGIPAISNIDTRALTRHIRNKGALRAGLSTTCLDKESLLSKVLQSPSLQQQNLAQSVSVNEAQFYVDNPSEFDETDDAACPRYKVVAYDCGAKQGILKSLVQVGCEVELVPWNTTAEEVLSKDPHGVFFSNGPGDPEPLKETIAAARCLLGKLPVFGVCLGHQVMARAIGARTSKLKFGHHGGNHPVMNLLTGKVEITAQNHGFGIDFSSIGSLVPQDSGGEEQHHDDLLYWVKNAIAPVVNSEQFGRVKLTHVNLNDGTPEGIQFLDIPALSVQFHPEASPGPSDGTNLFSVFAQLMDTNEAVSSQGSQDTQRGGAHA